MKWNNEEITNPNHLARTMILNVLIGLEDQVHKEMFGGLDIRSDIAKRILQEHQNFEVSDFEAEVLLKNISFEIAKIIGKLENQTGIDTGLVARNNQGYVDRQSYKI